MRVAVRAAAATLAALASSGGAGACAPRQGTGAAAAAGEGVPGQAGANLEAARELDQQGVKAFAEGRYADAVRLFRAAQTLGGPPSEIWNVARSLEQLDDAEGACSAIDEYLASRGLDSDDRAEAERKSQALKTRPSWLTVTTTPGGASVAVDGQAVGGPTPTTVPIRAGVHALLVQRAGFSPESRVVEARFGRALVVVLDLAAARK